MSAVFSQVLASTSDGQILNMTPAVGGDVGQVGGNTPLVTLTTIPLTVQTQKPNPDLDTEKQAIYRHQLFPLMALLFEKCEALSLSRDTTQVEKSFDADIQAFVHHQEKEKQPFFSDNAELDELMLKAIQVLRIHLLELEKVNELCKDFCNRYITCLKGKLQSENLLRTESDYDQSMFDEPPPEDNLSPVQMQGANNAGTNVLIQQNFQSNVSTMPALGPGQIMSGGTVYQMVQTPQGLVAQPIQIQPQITTLTTPLIHGSTPLSQIGAIPSTQITSPTNSSVTNSLGSLSSAMDSDEEDGTGKKKSKRGVLPKSATQIMKSWLFQHIVHPYPTEDEKRQIASQTNLTLLQVNNWFINARRRILQPMLDASNPEQTKAKKAKHSSRPPQRFWPFSTSTAESSESESSLTEAPSITTTAPITAPTTPSLHGQAIILGPGSFFTANGQIVNLQQANMAAMLEQVRQTSSSPIANKDTNDNNNNSNSIEEDFEDEEENERTIKDELT